MIMRWNGDVRPYSAEGWLPLIASLLREEGQTPAGASRVGIPRRGHAEDRQDLDMAVGGFSRDAGPVRL